MKTIFGFLFLGVVMAFIIILYYTIQHNRELMNECQVLGRSHFDCEMSIRQSYQHNYFNNGTFRGE